MENIEIDDIYIKYPEMTDEEINGRWKTLDFNNVTRYIQDYHRFKPTNEGLVDIIPSVMYAIYVLHKKPVKYDKMSKLLLPNTIKATMHHLIRYSMLKQISDTGLLNIDNYRKGDLINDPTFINLDETSAEYKALNKDAKSIISMISKNEDLYKKTEENSAFCVWLLFLNDMCRSITNGHNYLTNELTNKNNYLSKLMNIAGSEVNSFRDFTSVDNLGHDLYHFMNNKLLHDLCMALRGETDLYIPKGKSVFNVISSSDNTKVCNMIALPQALLDRYPPGVVGTSSLILSLGYIHTMVNDIRSKSIKIDSDRILKSLPNIEKTLSNKKLSREDLLQARKLLGPIAAKAIGYCTVAVDLEVEKHASLKNILNLNNYEFNQGILLAKTVKKVKVEDKTDKEVAEQGAATIGEDFATIDAKLGKRGMINVE